MAVIFTWLIFFFFLFFCDDPRNLCRRVPCFGKGSFRCLFPLSAEGERFSFPSANSLFNGDTRNSIIRECNILVFMSALPLFSPLPFPSPVNHSGINYCDKSVKLPIPTRVYAQFTDSGRSFCQFFHPSEHFSNFGASARKAQR